MLLTEGVTWRYYADGTGVSGQGYNVLITGERVSVRRLKASPVMMAIRHTECYLAIWLGKEILWWLSCFLLKPPAKELISVDSLLILLP